MVKHGRTINNQNDLCENRILLLTGQQESEVWAQTLGLLEELEQGKSLIGNQLRFMTDISPLAV